MGRVTVAWENRPTLDGRIIELEALVPRSPRLPIYYDFSYTTPLGWAEDFSRHLNPDTGWGEISFELYFQENWEAKLRTIKVNPTIAMAAKVERKTPYDQPEEVNSRLEYLSGGEIVCVSFSPGFSAWGDTGSW